MASGNDMKKHNSTYDGFIGLVKWSIAITAVVTIFTIYMISR
jgi:hypothetical protein